MTIEYEIETWEAGGFARDTMIHGLGALAERLIRYALADPDAKTRTGVAPPRPPTKRRRRTLVEAGLWGGHAKLYAGELPDEYMLTCHHDDFVATVVAGFEGRTERLLGVCVSEFEGDTRMAVLWARTFAAQLQTRPQHVLSKLSPQRVH